MTEGRVTVSEPIWRADSADSVQLVSHLQCEDSDDRLVVTNAVLHVAGVQVLPDLKRVLLILLQLFDFLSIQFNPVAILFIRERHFGSESPQNSVGPGRFTLLTTGQLVADDGQTESREAGFS